jgi:predicted RNase H-like HicB family nuclease
MEGTMKSLKALRIKIKIGELWVSPDLHILLTMEGNIFVARCLDFTVSSHGEDERDALKNLAEAIKEYILTAIENDNINTLYDPAHNKYWRMFNEREVRQLHKNFKRSMSVLTESSKKFEKLTAELTYA